MKKYFLIAAMAVAALTVNAQDSQDYKKVHVTPHWGLGYANISNDGYADVHDFAIGNVGADVEFMATKNLGFSVGADFSYAECPKKDVVNKTSFKVDDINFKGDLKYSENYTFANVPVLVQYHVGRFAVKAGVQANFLLEAKSKINSKVTISDDHTTAHSWAEGSNSIKDNYNTVTWSVPVGVSYSFKVPVTLDLRANIPVSKFSKSSTGWDQKFTTAMLTVGYRF